MMWATAPSTNAPASSASQMISKLRKVMANSFTAYHIVPIKSKYKPVTAGTFF